MSKNSKHYTLFFRMPKKILSPLFIEALIKGGYHHFLYTSNKDDPDVEWYISDEAKMRASKEGLGLYKNRERVRNLIARGKKLSCEIDKFISFSPKKKQPIKNDKDMMDFFVKARDYFVRYAKIYSYTEDMYSGEVQKIIRNFVFEGIDNKQKVNRILSKLLDSSVENRHDSNDILQNLEKNFEIKNLCESVKIVGEGKFILRPSLNKIWLFLDKILILIAKHVDLPPNLIDYCLYKEVVDLFNNSKNKKEILKKIKDREEVFVIFHKKGRVVLLSGKKAREVIKIIRKPISLGDISELKGDIASVGYAKGRVVVLPIGVGKNNKTELNKKIANMRQGDIIVAQATGPEMRLAFKKAGAIICEWGGITSHAAVISRELKIPGIINTKIATKVLKDGDFVEVDTEKGVVRILKRYRNLHNKKRQE